VSDKVLEQEPGGARRFRLGAAGRWRPEPTIWMGLLLSLPLVLVMASLVFFPLAKLMLDSITRGDGFGNYSAFFASPAAVRALRVTFIDSAIVTVLALLLGSVLAWNLRVQRSTLVRAMLWAITLMPFWMGVVVKNYALTIILQRRGIVNELLQLLPFVNDPIPLLYTQGAVIVGILYSLLPYAVLSLYVTFSTIDTDLVLAAEGLGAARYRALTSVVLPLAAPGLLATGAIIFVLSIGFYVTPILLGGAQSPFVASLIQRQIFSMFNYPAAAASGTILVVTAFVILGVIFAIVGRERLRRAMA
jgi:mannopine transport system permease protein